jgi:hypothetical protein
MAPADREMRDRTEGIMTATKWIIAGSFGLGLACSGTALAAGTPPDPGYYTATVFVVVATGPENTCEFVAQTGETYTGTLYYPGPGQTGATLRVPTATDNGPDVYIHELPETPASGKDRWTGSGQEGYEGGTGLMSETYSATMTFLDSSSFTMTENVYVSVTAGKVCHYGANVAFVRTVN